MTLNIVLVKNASTTIHELMGQWIFVHGFWLWLQKAREWTIGFISIENPFYFATKSTVSENLHVLLRIALEPHKKLLRTLLDFPPNTTHEMCCNMPYLVAIAAIATNLFRKKT